MESGFDYNSLFDDPEVDINEVFRHATQMYQETGHVFPFQEDEVAGWPVLEASPAPLEERANRNTDFAQWMNSRGPILDFTHMNEGMNHLMNDQAVPVAHPPPLEQHVNANTNFAEWLDPIHHTGGTLDVHDDLIHVQRRQFRSLMASGRMNAAATTSNNLDQRIDPTPDSPLYDTWSNIWPSPPGMHGFVDGFPSTPSLGHGASRSSSRSQILRHLRRDRRRRSWSPLSWPPVVGNPDPQQNESDDEDFPPFETERGRRGGTCSIPFMDPNRCYDCTWAMSITLATSHERPMRRVPSLKRSCPESKDLEGSASKRPSESEECEESPENPARPDRPEDDICTSE
ncbi:Fc.00g030860.m01.CDS01 [Cosmosporella sp. VM-42]